MTNYTFTFEQKYKNKFSEILSRLDPDEYVIIEDVHLTKPEDGRNSDMQAVIEMEPEACLTFRLGMKEVKIRRARTEEELAEEKAINDRHTVKITVQVPTTGTGPGGTNTI